MPSKDEVFSKVQTALVDALGVDEDEVTPEATLVGDLGASTAFSKKGTSSGEHDTMDRKKMAAKKPSYNRNKRPPYP